MPDRAEIIKKAVAKARKDWLDYTAQQEKEILQLFQNAATEISDEIAKRTAEGKIVPARLNILLQSVKDEAAILRKQLASKVQTGMKNSIDYGLKAGIAGAKDVLPSQFKAGIGSSFLSKSGGVVKYDAKEELYKTSMWAKINSNAMDFLMRYQTGGETLSDRIWDSVYQSEKAIRNRIQMAVLSGESAAKLSRDIRGYLIQPETLRGRVKAMYRPGVGVYKSAYKNAMRVARTEMARAYVEGQYRYGKEKTWIKGYTWRTGSGDPCPICADYDGTYFEKDTPPPIPAHANCMCYAEEVLDDDAVFPSEEEVEKQMHKDESSLVERRKETGIAYDITGKIFSVRGDKNGVYYSGERIADLRNREGVVLTHNHPRGTSFSLDDIRFAHSANLQEIRAVGLNTYAKKRVIYKMSRTGETWGDIKEIEKVFNREYRKAEEKYIERILSEGLDEKQYQSAVFHEAWKETTSQVYNIKYDMIDWRE